MSLAKQIRTYDRLRIINIVARISTCGDVLNLLGSTLGFAESYEGLAVWSTSRESRGQRAPGVTSRKLNDI